MLERRCVDMIGTVRETRGEGGQTIILMVLLMTVMFVVGAITVDVGLWLSERRGAQADADFVALSGAWELLDPSPAAEANALNAVNQALAANDEQLNASLIGVEVTLVGERCVSVDVGHESRPLFFQIFGVGAPEIGAHATACAGAASGPGNLVPFQIDELGPCYQNGQPIFAEMCPIELGAQGGNPRGMLDLDAPDDFCSDARGDGAVEELIINAAPGVCFINTIDDCDPSNNGPWYDCVAIQDGNPKKIIDGVAARGALDGDCDGNGNGWDDFDETVDLVFGAGDSGIYSPRDCDPSTAGTQASPRLVTLIVLKEPPPTNAGPTGFPILAFAGFYIAGCASEEIDVVDENTDGFDRYCTLKDTGPPGKAVVYGRFVNIIVTGGDIGDPTDQTTAFAIALVE